ncbi:hypothetical protein [Anaerovorax sp. IOR16]|uniref:hypothetical protein n=1 Tax=Anaerovorax sp. IOR16 TaxID=2773458 RepID=UPI0019D0D2EB|nr:hypothetical protein [Anaerovorax sp. IOR16]
MDIKDVVKVLNEFNFSPLHDYDLKENCIEWLGLFEDTMELLKTKLTDEWEIVERKRNSDNDFLRVDIVRK